MKKSFSASNPHTWMSFAPLSGVSESVEYWEIGVEFMLEKETVYWVVVKALEAKGGGR